MVQVINTKAAPAAIGPYSQGIITDSFIYTSGQIPVNPVDGTIPATIEEQAKQALSNVKAVLEAAGASVEDVIKTTVFLSDMENFTKVNELYGACFCGPVLPARSCVEVARLPKDVMIEIEAVAIRK